MVSTWKQEDAEDFICKNCASVYTVTIKRFPLRDNDRANCEVCGQLLKEWNNTIVPSFTLKHSGNKPSGAA